MSDHSFNSSAAPVRSRLVVQGEFEVSNDPGIVLTTLLGSCVATCLCDPAAGVGGMNHFLLASHDGGAGANERYGSYAMEVLINGLLKLGARKSRLEAKIFGGATMAGRMGRIGEANCAFARDYLDTEKIPLVSSSLGGDRARRLRYVPVTGQAQMLFVAEAVPAARAAAAPVGDVDLF
ncbi:chemotaxis protein CheD [Roseivivax sediminis]|uniref:Probable chemoreceptor glutamine deamidase CheD n=1 Tax=Roseivivax sediminis TaxID=936889 RepID=A0A1I1XTB0_9RHOB|nr:chemotaxis protein CheD [Roseivivax sediminis]SFE08840.1 chemotaxis protein CheD [Roseivivax sediminis]